MKKMKQIQMILAMLLFQCPGIMRVGGAGSSGLPRFTYTGTYTLIDDGNRNWRINGANNWYDAGCSGICVIRNHRAA